MANDGSGDRCATVELPALAELLVDQIATLDDARPTGARVAESGAVVVFTFVWPYIPADAIVARSSQRGQLVRLRELLLEEMTRSLLEVVQIDRHREVRRSASELGGDPRHATVSFWLGASLEDEGDDVEALRNWSAQVRRHAREQRRRLHGRRAELRRVREQLASRRRPPETTP